MLAVPATDLPPDDARWAYEMKWDGMRALVGVERGDVWATSRAGNDATRRFAPVAIPLAELPVRSAVLDGEIAVLDERGVTHLALLDQALRGRIAGVILV